MLHGALRAGCMSSSSRSVCTEIGYACWRIDNCYSTEAIIILAQRAFLHVLPHLVHRMRMPLLCSRPSPPHARHCIQWRSPMPDQPPRLRCAHACRSPAPAAVPGGSFVILTVPSLLLLMSVLRANLLLPAMG